MAWNPAIVQAVASGGSGILGSILSSESAKKNTERTIAANREMAQYSYSKDLEMWNLQNQYNSPASQMARLKAAGLNPNLVYGQGAGTAGNAAQMPKYNAPTAQYNYKPLDVSFIPEVLGQYQDFQMKQAQIDNVKAQTQNVGERTASEDLKQVLLQLKEKTGKFDLDTKSILRPYQTEIESSKAQASKAKVQQEWKRLILMSKDEQLKNLQALGIQTEIDKKQSEILFNKYRNEWMRMGVTGSDNYLVRILSRMLSESGLSDPIFEGLDKGGNWLKSLFK